MTELALAIAGAKSDTKLSNGESSGQAIPIMKFFFAINAVKGVSSKRSGKLIVSPDLCFLS